MQRFFFLLQASSKKKLCCLSSFGFLKITKGCSEIPVTFRSRRCPLSDHVDYSPNGSRGPLEQRTGPHLTQRTVPLPTMKGPKRCAAECPPCLLRRRSVLCTTERAECSSKGNSVPKSKPLVRWLEFPAARTAESLLKAGHRRRPRGIQFGREAVN